MDRAESIKRELQALVGAGRNIEYLPSILQYLDLMIEKIGAPEEERSRLASGLVRVLMEDSAFLESPVGHKITNFANEFADSPTLN